MGRVQGGASGNRTDILQTDLVTGFQSTGRLILDAVKGLFFKRVTQNTGVRYPMVSLEFFTDIILRIALWPWG